MFFFGFCYGQKRFAITYYTREAEMSKRVPYFHTSQLVCGTWRQQRGDEHSSQKTATPVADVNEREPYFNTSLLVCGPKAVGPGNCIAPVIWGIVAVGILIICWFCQS